MRTALLIGIIAGLALGLVYAWLVEPVEFTSASPAEVEARYREAWLLASAEAYVISGDWERTQMRLNALRDPNLKQVIAALFDRLDDEGPNPQARALAYVADRLGARTAGMVVYLSTPIVTPTPVLPTAIPTRPGTAIPPTPTPTDSFPTPTPTATPAPEFELVSSNSTCQAGLPQIRVTVQAADGTGLPGVDVWITWDGGADRFVTGLKPEFGAGFGDFDMQPDVSYRVGAGTQSALALVNNVRANACTTDDGEAGRLSWDIVLQPVE